MVNVHDIASDVHDCTLTSCQASTFIDIVNSPAEGFDAEGLGLASYAVFEISGIQYRWYGEFVGLQLPANGNVWLVWKHPVFVRMNAVLERNRYEALNEAVFRDILSELEPADPAREGLEPSGRREPNR